MRRPNRRPNYMETEDITNYEAAYDYLVYIDGTSYVAINGDTGAELSRGADAATVINLALAKTGCVYLKAGTYPIKTLLGIPSNTSLHGCGRTTILQHHADLANSTVIENFDTIGGNSDIEVYNLAIDGNDSAHATSSIGIQYQNVVRGNVKDVYVYDTGIDGVRFRTCDYSEMRNINAKNTGNHATFIGYASSYCIIDGVVSEDPKTEHVCIEHQLAGVDNKYISVSNVVGHGAENHGIYIQHAQFVTLSNFAIYDTAEWGVYVNDADTILIENGIADGTVGNKAPFTTEVNATNVLINNCASFNSQGATYSAYMLKGNRITLANSIASACMRPIETNETTSDFIHVYGCTFENYTDGILVKGDNVKFHDNVFSNPVATPAYCFYESGSTNLEIYNNDVTAATTGDEIRNYTAVDRVDNNIGWVTENGGAAAAIADGGTIAHGLDKTPTHVSIVGSVAGDIISVSALGAANITLAIKDEGGGAGTAQTIYWRAWV